MIEEENALYAVTARFFKGLGDPARLRILEFLRSEERSVSEIVEHLGCLRWCGYVNTRRDGRWVYYSIGDQRVSGLLDLARDMLNGSEVYLMTCDVIGDTDENPANVTGWRKTKTRA